MGNSQTETLALTLKISNLNLGLALLTERGQYGKAERSRLISCLLYGFLLWFCGPVIGPWALR